MTRRRMRSKLFGRWITTVFRGRSSARAGTRLFARKHKTRRRRYR